MSKEQESAAQTLGLSTKVEEDFISPLTSLRGALEILRDYPELPKDEREQFLGTALRGCARLEQSVEDLSKSVYSAGLRAQNGVAAQHGERAQEYYDRIRVHEDSGIVEIDFSSFEFSSNEIVNDFHDAIEEVVDATGRDWYFVVNYSDCSIWPEAWIAFAHRGKRIKVSHSLGTVRYIVRDDADGDDRSEPQPDSYDPDLFDSREAAFAKIAEMKAADAIG